VTDLSQRGTEIDPRSVHVRCVVNKVAIGHVVLPVLLFSPASTIPPMLHTHLHLHVALTRRTNERILGTFQQSVSNGPRRSVS
jgi:hypothetical protein